MNTAHATSYEPAHAGGRKRILFVTDDPLELQKMQNLASGLGNRWEAAFASGGKIAMEMMADLPLDVVLSDLGMNRASGLEFLSEVWRKHPKTIRFLTADKADSQLITGCALDTNQFLPKPLTIEDLTAATERVCGVDALIGSGPIKDLVSHIRSFPSLPSVYFEVMKEIGSASSSPQSIGERIAKDLAMTTKMIQTVNSAYFGLQRQITDPGEAVMVLGLETVRALVLGVHAFALADKIKPLYFSADRIWRHSLAVAETARKITLWETREAQMADAAYTAGLLHDIGKLILAANFDAQYGNALALAKKQHIAPTDIERDIFGVTHAETGAYMLSLWGLPLPIIEATALHHAPSKCLSKSFSALAAIHIANVLEHEANPGQDGFVDLGMDRAYLTEIKLDKHLDEWRAQLRGAKAPSKPKPSTSSGVGISTAVAPEPTGQWRARRWKSAAPIAAAAAIAMTLLAWKMFDRPVPAVQARTLRPQEEQASAIDAASHLASPPPGPVAIATQAWPLASAASAATNPVPAGDLVAPRGFAGLKLQGVIFRSANPMVIINGKTLHRGEAIQGVRVAEINRQGARLEFAGENRFLQLPP